MTDQQLYLAIGVPMVFNIGTMLLGFTLISTNLNKRIDDIRSEMGSLRSEISTLRSDMNSRLDLMSRLFTEQLRRVEEILDARLKHLEER